MFAKQHHFYLDSYAEQVFLRDVAFDKRLRALQENRVLLLFDLAVKGRLSELRHFIHTDIKHMSFRYLTDFGNAYACKIDSVKMADRKVRYFLPYEPARLN